MTLSIVDENTLNRTSTETWENLGLEGGTPRDVWDADGSDQIEGFATDISVNHGTTVDFKINVNANPGEDIPYHIEVYRLGYYGGDGATLVYQSGPLTGNAQPAAIFDPATGMVDAGNWSVSTGWDVPADATSGVYLVKLVRDDNGATNQIPFIVRDDDAATKSDIILQTSDTTWHAYNGWGGNNGEVKGNFYGDPSGTIDHEDVADPGLGAQDRAYAVSYNRPFLTRDGGGAASGAQDYLFGADYAAIYFLEKNGYDVSYISGVDTDRLGADYLIGHKAYISVGHDEYWSGQQRFNVEEARDAGVNLLFWSGNEVYWKTRLESSAVTTDGSPTDYRTLVSYKETWANGNPNATAADYANIDPANDWTGTWRDMRFVDAVDEFGNHIAGGSRFVPLSGNEASCSCITGAGPENSLTGQLFGPDGTGQFGAAIDVPAALAGLRVWRDTSVAVTGQLDIAPGILGYEWNTSPEDEYRPDGLIYLSDTVDIPWNAILVDQGNNTQPGVATHNLSLYRAESGALVFGAGTVFWSWGLSDEHDSSPYGANIENVALKQFTLNMFADMGIQPEVTDAILASQGLVRATQSTDNVAPTTTVSIQGNPTEVTEGQIVTITGTATDDDGNPITDDGQVAAIEVSTDNGVTWHVATGTANWTYSWRATGPGTHTIKARAIDDSVNLQNSNVQSTELSVMASPDSRLFLETDGPTQFFADGQAVEVGVKFQSSTAGSITQLFFYKSPNETGTHEGHLWTVDGTLLVTFTFDTETASGWQTATLDTPFTIAGGTTYVASYHANISYGATSGFFVADYVSGSLTALASGTSGGNGVYDYGAGTLFPTSSFNASNYWVDVSFTAFSGPNGAPVITSGNGNTDTASVAENTTSVTTVVAVDPDAGQNPVYSIVLPTFENGAGADGALFQIDPQTGALTFINAPNFETPADDGGDNVYEVTVQASDSLEPNTLFDQQTISVTVTDEFEPVAIGFDGKTVHAEWLWSNEPDGQLGGSPLDVLVTDGAGPELVAFPEEPGNPGTIGNNGRGLADIDIEATSIIYTFPIDQTLFPGQTLDFLAITDNGPRISDTLDALRPILNVVIASQSGFASDGVDASDIIFTADSIYVYLGGEARVDGATLVLDVTFANEVPVITSNGGGATTTINIDENTTAVTTVTASDADAVDAKEFSILASEDSALFSIDSNTGVLTLNSPLDFENLPDAGATAGYQVLVQVEDGYGGTDTQLITVNINDVNEDTDADAGDDAAVSISEAVINAAEVGTVEYTISGVDADATAEVTFISSGGGTPVVVSGLGNGTTDVNLSSLPDGTISASIVVTDNASNTASGTGDIASLDTVADAAPVASVTFNDVDGFVSASEAGTTSYTIADVDGDATATVTFSDGVNPDVVVSGLGNGTTLVDLSSLTDGPITASISVTDNAGNTANGTGDNSTKDTTADAAPLTSVAFNDGDGFVSAAETATASYTIAGVDADATATVTFSDSNPLHDVTVAGLGNGGFSVDLSGLTDGSITASIVVTDTAGNSAPGTGDTSIKDMTADSPADLAVTINDGDGFISAAEAATVSYTIAGVDADAAATVTFSDSNPLHDVTVAGLGNGGFTANLSGLTDGPVTASISSTDTAGNTANGTGDTSTKDTIADSPADLAVTFNDVDGFVSAAEAASVSYTIAGVDADATATVAFSDGINPDVVVSGLGNGTTSVDLSSLSDGPITAAISVTDTAGNSTTGTGDSSTKDTTADAAPVASVVFDDGDGFVSASEAATAGYTIAGVDADATATVTFSDGINPDVVVSGLGNGTTSVDLSSLSDGPITASISVTDTAGNSANGTGDSSTKDITADTPADLAVTFNDGDGFISAAEAANVSYTVAGVDADAAATVTFSDGVNPDVVVSGLGNGTTSVDLSSLSDGPITASISVTDTAGNSTNGTGDSSTKDTDAPNAPTILLAEDNVGPETGNLSSGDTTDDNVPVLRVRLVGTNAAAGDSVQIFSGVSALITALISANDLNNGYVSVTLPSLIDNTYDFSAKVVDVAGNASDSSTTFTLNVEADTGEPPTDILLSNSTVVENVADALVGTLNALDPDAGDSFTFTLLDDADGRFAIVGNSLRTTGALDFEDEGFWDIQVQVTDASNNTIEETFEIQVGDVDGVKIKGSQGNDVISAAKTVIGQPKATGEEDTILGRGGNDSINGAGGDDTIKGGAGDDKIIGGLGVDQLFGNAGADKFIFRTVADSLVADADTIKGFSHSQHDKIDLHLIDAVDDSFLAGNQAFHFIGTADFTGGNTVAAAGELRFNAIDHKVEGDIDGDGTADFAISVNVGSLVSGDFIL